MIDLKEKYGKRYKVTRCQCGGEHSENQEYEILGKRGYISLCGDEDLEMYLTSTHLCARIERLYKQFKPKNHYDDATAFVFSADHIPEACKFIRAKNRRQVSPETLERLKLSLQAARSKRHDAIL